MVCIINEEGNVCKSLLDSLASLELLLEDWMCLVAVVTSGHLDGTSMGR